MRPKTVLHTVALAGLSLLVARCDSLENPLSEENRIVVESFHEVGQPLGSVRFMQAVDVQSAFVADNQGISGATVLVSLLATDGSIEKTFEYSESPDVAGVYRADDPDDVLAEREYQLEITHPEVPEVVRASTLTPGTFEIVRPGLDEVVYQQDPQFELGVTRSEFPDRQTIFVFSVESLDPKIDNLTPIYLDLIDPDSDSNQGLTEEEILEDVIIVESPPINEGNYEILADNTLDVQLPWLAVAFYGPQNVMASAIDENLYDFIRSNDIQQGGSTLSPGEIPNVINRIEGATGVFGAYARVAQETNVLRE